jgi:flagellar basal-body rod modification protein FlgD
MTSEISIDTAINQQRQTNATVASLAEDFTQFLTLLTTQLQNQDPLNPMETNEFTDQLVQFSQVEQQINSNQKLDSLVQLQLSNAFGLSLGYVGLDINYLSSEFNFDGASPVSVNYALEDSASESRIFVLDEAGDVVFSTEAEKEAGAHEFVWDGTSDGGELVPPGTYNIRVDAVDFSGDAIESSTVVSGKVQGVETQNGQIFLIVGERAVPLANVLKAREPGSLTIPDAEPDNENAAADDTPPIEEEAA